MFGGKVVGAPYTNGAPVGGGGGIDIIDKYPFSIFNLNLNNLIFKISKIYKML